LTEGVAPVGHFFDRPTMSVMRRQR
jgi:hypothetical protein